MMMVVVVKMGGSRGRVSSCLLYGRSAIIGRFWGGQTGWDPVSPSGPIHSFFSLFPPLHKCSIVVILDAESIKKIVGSIRKREEKCAAAHVGRRFVETKGTPIVDGRLIWKLRSVAVDKCAKVLLLITEI
jgi:hypothetical protein